MRHALILAGGSGVRLWPMSREDFPKQLIPFIGGKSLLELAWERLRGLVPPDRCYVCAGARHRQAVLQALPELPPGGFLGEPVGRDTLNAIGFSAAVIARRDPDATIAVFTADHLIEPAGEFQRIVTRGYEVVERHPDFLVTFGVEPTFPSTGYGYLQLGAPLEDGGRLVERFQEKPDAAAARRYFESGPQAYLWNSGMFVWRAATLLDCIRRFSPANYAGLMRIAEAWDAPGWDQVAAQVYPGLDKISVDYAVMEPASRDAEVRVAALAMPLRWLDVGSWATFAAACPAGASGNRASGAQAVFEETSGTLAVSSDPEHLIAALGCEDLIIVHTADATLVCRADRAEAVKALQQIVRDRFGGRFL
jgi:mannose-1-phosphate guanylyltransferase